MQTAFVTAIALALNGATASAQIYRVAEMNTEQLRALDRTRTVVLLPAGYWNSTVPTCRRSPMAT